MNFTKTFALPHQGLLWVVVLHALINAGLVAVAFHTHFALEVQSKFEVAKVLGAGRGMRIVNLVLPMTFPFLVQTFFLVFAICLVSFSIPLVLSGGTVTSLEVHIFRLVRSEGLWGLALFYSLLQTLTVVGLATLFWFYRWTRESEIRSEVYSSSLSKGFRWLAWLPLSTLSVFWMKDVILFFFSRDVLQVFDFFQSFPVMTAAINSLILLLLVFLFQSLLCVCVTFGSYSRALEKFFQGYLAPSVAVLGFSMSLLPGESEFLLLCKTALCFTFVTFPLLFRWQVLSRWKGLSSQIQVAKTLGGSQSGIFWNVVWPQMKSTCFTLALMAAVWSLGDFAVSSFFLHGDQTLALMILDLLNKYKLELASFLSFALFCFGAGIFYGVQRTLIHVDH